MLKNRIENLEEQNKRKTKKYKNFNAFYEDLKNGDAEAIASFNRFYGEDTQNIKV